VKIYEIFRFKEFAINHQNSAMKVGTDGVLLGAWSQAKNPETILDIGTGTGLVALMCAQRFREANVIGIEYAETAHLDALLNFSNSPFASRLTALCGDIIEYSANFTYDLITCNPPYFVKSMKSSDSHRNLARHQDSLPLDRLFEKVHQLLSPKGGFALIIPSNLLQEVVTLSENLEFCITKKTFVKGNENAEPKRVLLQLTKQYQPIVIEELVIELERHQYTPEYVNLTKDFYLKM